MKKDNIVKEFIDGFPEWKEAMNCTGFDWCPICGMQSKMLEELVLEVKELMEKADKYDSLCK